MAAAGATLVTGAAGFVGRHLLDWLVARGGDVAAWHRPGTATESLRGDVAWAGVDLTDRHAVREAVASLGPAAIYHLAGAAHVAQSWGRTFETYEANVLATHHLFCALRECGLRPRVLVACSGTIYAPQDRPLQEEDPLAPGSPYATSKLAQEMVARRAWEEDGIPALVARSFNHTGPGQDASYVAPGIARQIARIEAGVQEPLITVGNLEPRRDLSDVRDVVRAYGAMMAAAHPGRPYNVCSGRELSIRALVRTLVSRSSRPIRIEQNPALFRPHDPPLLVGSRARLTADTGWTPVLPFERTVDDLIAYWRERVRVESSPGASPS